jgi:hypothetical protein
MDTVAILLGFCWTFLVASAQQTRAETGWSA